MQPLIEYRLDLAGFSTRALELEGEGTPILLLHGYGDSADTWRLVLDRLARAERRAIALDLPGFGTAAPLRPGEAVLPQYDAFAAAAVRHVVTDGGATEVVVAGNSLGGCIALRVAERCGELPVAGIVPVAPAGLEMPRWFNAIERDPIVRTLLAAPVPLPESLVRGMVGAVYRQLAFSSPGAPAREVVSSFTSHHRDRAAVRRLLDTGRRVLPELSRAAFRLEQIGCPVLLVWGDRDRMVTHRGARHIVDAVPGTAYELFEGCGHCPQLEETDRVAELLLAFAGEAVLAA
jgi:pimeloyl-ACP methyl ester carboxylesterase